jgi:REP element-mobilizing transposase RayT
MARPLRIELSGGIYHVTSRGDGREAIFLNDQDRMQWLEILGQVCERFNWVCHAWCQMSNHYHLLIETPEANLAQGMRHLNGVYTQHFNRSHKRVGHVFQGRYKAIIVERESYLMELARYIVLNPLRANMIKQLVDWQWSSYQATCGQEPTQAWLQTDWILAQFSQQRSSAIAKYIQFVHEGARLPSVWGQLQGQIYLGSETFVKNMQAQIEKKATLAEIPRAQRRAVTQPLENFEKQYERNEAMARAYLSGQHTMAAIAQHFGVHYATVSRAVNAFKTNSESA